MRLSRFRSPLAALAVMAGAAITAACSPDTETAGEPPAAPAETAAAATNGDAAPSGAGELGLAELVGDGERGRRVFRQCQACHTLEPGQNRVGPSLNGVLGRVAGSVEGFRYSRANAESAVEWSEETLFDYLANPRAYIPGTTMAYVGLRDAQQRADVIAFIRENGG